MALTPSGVDGLTPAQQDAGEAPAATREGYARWLDALAADRLRRFGRLDGLGTANLVDEAARLRARDDICTGRHLRLSRPIAPPRAPPDTPADTPPPALVVTPRYTPEYAAGDAGRTIGAGTDRVEITCHGFGFTHMDAPNHLMVDRTFYGAAAFGSDPPPDAAGLAAQCFFTRAVLADVTAARGTPWVSPDEPVDGPDIDRALRGAAVAPGDALILYMGRDRYEAAGHAVGHGQTGVPGDRRPGAGEDAARWIADHGVSVLLWDLQDAVHDGHTAYSVHRLIAAIGLVLVDNCHLGEAATTLAAAGRHRAALIVQPVGFPGATGSVVEPYLVL